MTEGIRAYARPYAADIVWAAAYACVAAASATVPIAIIAVALSRGLRGSLDARTLAGLAVGLALSIVVRVLCASVAGRRFREALALRAERLRIDVIERLRLAPARRLALVDAGRAVAGLTTGLDEALETLGDAFDTIFEGLAKALLVVAILVAVDWRVALVSLAFLPLVAGYVWRSRGISARATPRLVRARAEGSSRFFEYVESVALLRAFGLSAERTARFARALRELEIKAFETSIASFPMGVLALFFIEFGFAITVMVGTQLGAIGADGIRFVIALTIALAYFQTVYDALDGYLRLRDARANLDDVGRLLDVSQAGGEGSSDVPASHELALERVRFSYDRGPVLHDISLRFPARGVTAIVGRSGAGKSALTGIIAGLWDPSAGTVSVGGTDLAHLTSDARARTVALVFQETTFSTESIARNIAAGRPDATPCEVRDAARLAGCDEFVEALAEGYDTPVRAGGAEFSPGERQRLAIARALLAEAPIVVFDECTASLDAAAERAVHAAIATLARSKTVVLVTHRLATVRHARHIVVIASGRVAESGTHEALLEAGGEYALLWAAYERARTWRAAS